MENPEGVCFRDISAVASSKSEDQGRACLLRCSSSCAMTLDAAAIAVAWRVELAIGESMMTFQCCPHVDWTKEREEKMLSNLSVDAFIQDVSAFAGMFHLDIFASPRLATISKTPNE